MICRKCDSRGNKQKQQPSIDKNDVGVYGETKVKIIVEWNIDTWLMEVNTSLGENWPRDSTKQIQSGPKNGTGFLVRLNVCAIFWGPPCIVRIFLRNLALCSGTITPTTSYLSVSHGLAGFSSAPVRTLNSCTSAGCRILQLLYVKGFFAA